MSKTLKDNYSIGAYQLIWNEDYEPDLFVDISSFASAVISEIQERFPNRPLLNSIKILDHANITFLDDGWVGRRKFI